MKALPVIPRDVDIDSIDAENTRDLFLLYLKMVDESKCNIKWINNNTAIVIRPIDAGEEITCRHGLPDLCNILIAPISDFSIPNKTNLIKIGEIIVAYSAAKKIYGELHVSEFGHKFQHSNSCRIGDINKLVL
jgi:hypothetical protein